MSAALITLSRHANIVSEHASVNQIMAESNLGHTMRPSTCLKSNEHAVVYTGEVRASLATCKSRIPCSHGRSTPYT